MSKPTKYDLENPEEVKRLIRELRGYMQVSLNNGTDYDGRKFALEALDEIISCNYFVSIDTENFEPPTYDNRVI